MRKIKMALNTIVGRRERNEDSCIAIQITRNTYFLAVADGMGGAAGGHIASRVVIQSIESYLLNIFKNQIQAGDLKGILAECFNIAQKRIIEELIDSPRLKGMGTTLSAVLIHNENYVWGNIGDSRIYRLSGGTVQQITEDHSYIQDYLKEHDEKLPANIIAQYGNAVTRIIDGGTDIPDIFPEEDLNLPLIEGDLLLLCSDGLITDKTEDLSGKLKELISGNRSLRKVAANLVSWAFKGGATDNISVVLCSYGSIMKMRKQELANKTIVINRK